MTYVLPQGGYRLDAKGVRNETVNGGHAKLTQKVLEEKRFLSGGVPEGLRASSVRKVGQVWRYDSDFAVAEVLNQSVKVGVVAGTAVHRHNDLLKLLPL